MNKEVLYEGSGTEGATIEKERGPAIDFYVTDHALRFAEKYPMKEIEQIYEDMKQHGISSVRFDMDWDVIYPGGDIRNGDMLNRYSEALKTVANVGMKPPTVVLSNPPRWAQKLYETDKSKYMEAYETYVDTVAKAIESSGVKVGSAQLFNEVNHTVLFQYVEPEDLAKCADIAKRVLRQANPDIKIATSLIVANTNEMAGRVTKAIGKNTKGVSVNDFLDKYGQMLKDNFDLVLLDYYPGVWHLPFGEGESTPKHPLAKNNLGQRIRMRMRDLEHATMLKHWNALFSNMRELRETAERLSAAGIPYGIGEVGYPSNFPYNTEKRQRYFYDSFFRAFREMLEDLHSQGAAFPRQVIIYETVDEDNTDFGGFVDKVLKIPGAQTISRLTPNPEHGFGLAKGTGKSKEILRGVRGRELTGKEPSQLKSLINYVNRPFKQEGAQTS